MNHDERGKNTRLIGLYIDLGLRFGIIVLIGFLLGWWIDGKLHKEPLFTIIGLLFGIGSGLYHLYKSALDIEKIEKKSDDKSNEE